MNGAERTLAEKIIEYCDSLENVEGNLLAAARHARAEAAIWEAEGCAHGEPMVAVTLGVEVLAGSFRELIEAFRLAAHVDLGQEHRRFNPHRLGKTLRPWEADTTFAKTHLERFFRALVLCAGCLTSTLCLGDASESSGRTGSLFTMIWLPDGNLARFRTLARPEGIRPPARVQVGTRDWSCPHEECTQRCPPGHHGGSEWLELLGQFLG